MLHLPAEVDKESEAKKGIIKLMLLYIHGNIEINKLLNKLPLILLCTIRIDDSLFDCRVLPQQGRDGVTGQGTWVPYPFGINTERPRSFRIASNRLRM
jgi:hypothetical protein